MNITKQQIEDILDQELMVETGYGRAWIDGRPEATNQIMQLVEKQAAFTKIDYTLENAILDLSGVQLIDNTGGEADAAREEIESIFRRLIGDEQAP